MQPLSKESIASALKDKFKNNYKVEPLPLGLGGRASSSTKSFRTLSIEPSGTSTSLKARGILPPTAHSTSRKSLSFRQQMKQPKQPVLKLDPAKCSRRSIGPVVAFAGNTSPGLVRTYNEDRLTMVTVGREKRCSFFAIYDGHGGHACADFLKDNLHTYVPRGEDFPAQLQRAATAAILQAQQLFMDYAEKGAEKSGSCCLIAMTYGQELVVANVGDSRAIYSEGLGKRVVALTKDHRPYERGEYDRIVKAGGSVLQSKLKGDGDRPTYRVVPGRLSVSRTIGDIEAKCPSFGGLPGVVTAQPDSVTVRLTEDSDFLILGDGVTEVLSSEEVVRAVWAAVLQDRAEDAHRQCGLCADAVIRLAAKKKSKDNLSAVVVAFPNFSKGLFGRSELNLQQFKAFQSLKNL